MPTSFLQTLERLRTHEQVLLYDTWHPLTETDATEATSFLAEIYREEALDYPGQAPAFDPEAAQWAARTVYYACQFLLHRSATPTELAPFFPDFVGKTTPGAILSADLTLRFLPDILQQLAAIDPDDALIPLLESKLKTWHYSGISYGQPPNEPDVNQLFSDPCLYQLYIDRILLHKNFALARHPALQDGIRASLGTFTADFWPELELRL